MHRGQVRTMASATGGVLVLAGLVAAPAVAAQPAAGGPPTQAHAGAPPSPYPVIASGLNNPRHLSFARNGALYVAESGTGGSGPCIISSEGGQVCYGPTGSITEVVRGHFKHHKRWKQRRVVTGLPSLAPPKDIPPGPGQAPVTKGGSATGPSGAVVLGRHRIVVSVGLGAPPSSRGKGKATAGPTSTTPATLPRGLGTLLAGTLHRHRGFGFQHRAAGTSHRTWRVLADIARHEAQTNPVDNPDSNPASVARVGSRFLVADAGGNTVLQVTRRGRVRTLASFQDTMVQAPSPAPPGTMMPMQFVPTAAVRGPHHAYYVSQLTGFPFPKGGAAIWQLRCCNAPKVYASGLTNVTDLAFARDGSLYVVEISTEGLASGGPPMGALLRVPPGGGTPQVVAGGLFAPYGVALHGQYAYVTTGSILPGGGQVVRIPLS